MPGWMAHIPTVGIPTKENNTGMRKGNSLIFKALDCFLTERAGHSAMRSVRRIASSFHGRKSFFRFVDIG